jgi:hypothetical protein
MINNNLQKKKVVDNILSNYNTRMIALKQKRDKTISDFLEVLKEKKLEELRNSLKHL